MEHVPVLLHESIDGLRLSDGAVVVDGTLGAGGHASEIARRFGTAVTIVGFDLDAEALELAGASVKKSGGTLVPIHANFRTIVNACEQHGFTEIDGALFDLGISSMEIGESGRGFSFKYDEPLLMTLANPITDETLTAAEVVNGMRENELADMIYKYGEERFSRQIAKAIVLARRKAKIDSSLQLAEIIAESVPASYRNGRINPATKTFQALRIYVNDELGAAEEGIRGAWQLLKKGGRIAVITFHSLEDRLVKNLFKELKEDGGQIITKKPLIPTRKEIEENKRSRSAKLRIIEK
ncbi:MAG: 16S rRNA (cytosine(1402)-N(4))-methyltransferase RsmH [bacterium]